MIASRTGKERGDRHPKVRDRVVLCAGALLRPGKSARIVAIVRYGVSGWRELCLEED
jgi:hypothetical protein